jgi:uncharacterized protein (TIGR02145 family)
LSPLTVRGSQSHHAGRFCETPLRQAAGSLVARRDTVNQVEIKPRNMKTIFLIILMLFVFSGCKSKKKMISQEDPCNPIPEFGSSLGRISRGKKTKISNGKITQIWSDVVRASKCEKTNFCGGVFEEVIFYTDCRSISGFKGSLFSWSAVVFFGNQLCPAPWRVPTKEDFITLDILLGGTGERNLGNTHFNQYTNVWKSQFAGYNIGGGGLNGIVNQDWLTGYWSQSEVDSTHGYLLYLNDNIWLSEPQYRRIKDQGFALRCVRNK